MEDFKMHIATEKVSKTKQRIVFGMIHILLGNSL